jgi:hypothetical protein
MTANATTNQVERVELATGYTISASQGRLASRRRPRQGQRDQGDRGHGGVRQPALRRIRLRRPLYRRGTIIGDFRAAHPGLAPLVQVHTKFVPDLAALATINRDYVVGIIDRSLARLGVERLDLVQYYWWDWRVPGAVETAQVLHDLMKQGKIARLGVTNFNTDQFAQLIDAGIPFAAHQLQWLLRRSSSRLGR